MKRLLNYLLNKRWILSFVMLFLSESKKERIYIARFKAELSFFGFDVSDMTDEEIKEGRKLKMEMVSACGMSTNEVEQAMKAMASLN